MKAPRWGRRCTCDGVALVTGSVWRISHGLPEGTTWNYRCTTCQAEFVIHPVGLMLTYQVFITGLGLWLLSQAHQLTGRLFSGNVFSWVAWLVLACAVPFGWITGRRLLEVRRHPLVPAP